MKRMESEGAPRPAVSFVKKVAAVAACIILLAASVTAGYYNAPEDTRLPVLLSNGEVIKQPCYVAADGQCIALVKDEKEAEEVVDRVKDEYKNASTVQVEIEEKTSIKNMKLENGADKPEILTARQASERIVDKNALTVKTTEVIEETRSVKYKTIEKENENLDRGKIHVEQKGQNGVERVRKSVTKENGKIVSENILEQEVVKDCVPEIRVSGTKGLVIPLEDFVITSEFGPRWGRQHEGMDFGVPEGTPIYAALAGKVTFAGYTEGFGNLVIIEHEDGMETYYAHCSRIDVACGQEVETEQQIAAAGSTGNSTGPHLHFEVHVEGTARDPSEWLNIDE